MPWASWPQRELQREFDELAPGLLDRLEVILPALEPSLKAGDTTVHNLYARTGLVKALQSFAPEACFESLDYRKKCLDRLAPSSLMTLASRLGVAQGEFDETRDNVATVCWTGEDQKRKFLDFFTLPARFLRSEPTLEADSLDVKGTDSNSPSRPLFDYQKKVLAEASDLIAIPRSRFLIQMPTGSGKTRTAMTLVTNRLKTEGPAPVIFWLAHSEELCRQAFDTFVEQWQQTGDREVRACRLWGKHSAPQSLDKPILVVAGFQKLHGLIQSVERVTLEALRGRTRLVIVDEAHRSVAPTYRHCVDFLAGNDAKVVGLSATPGRTLELQNSELVDLYFGSIVEIAPDPGLSVVQYLQKLGVTSKLIVDPILSNRHFSLSPRQRKALESNLDFPSDFLDQVGRDDARNAEIIARLLGEVSAGRQTICFACSVEHSRFIASVLTFLGISADHVDGSTGENARRSIIDRFRAGELSVISNFGVLSTGFDAPNADTVMIARPTRSGILYSQMVGRGLRGPAMGGAESCRLIDVLDNIEGIGPIDDLFAQFADTWR